MVKKSRRAARRSPGLMKSMALGFGSLLTIAAPTHAATHLSRTGVESSLQGDFNRIGNDMRTAIAREKRREEASS